MSTIIDLRGRDRPPAPLPVLSDPSGRRQRVLALAGRVIGVLFLLWLLALGLAGLGLLPTSAIPFARGLGLQAPPALKTFPSPKPPTRSDLHAANVPGRTSSAAAQRARAAAHQTATGSAIGSLASGAGGASGSSHRAGSSHGNGSRPGAGGGGGGSSSGSGGGGNSGAGSATITPSTSGATGGRGHGGNPHTTGRSPGRSGTSSGHTVTHG